MALDRHDDDARLDLPDRHVRPEQHPGPDEPGDAGVPTARASAVESRTREEYYEALRAADGKPVGARSDDSVAVDGRAVDGRAVDGRAVVGGPVAGEARSGRCGWESVDATDRPSPEAISVSPERLTHILDGDPGGGGGHRHGVGKPGKTEFPASWDDKKIVDGLLDVARRPDLPPKHQEWNDRWVARGTRDDVGIVVVIARDGRIWTGWPTADSPGVVKNPKEL